MNHFLAWWVRNPIAANLLMIFIAVAGIFGFGKLSREVLPPMTYPSVLVTAEWIGASPAELEQQVALRIEDSLRAVANIKDVATTVDDGIVWIWVTSSSPTDFERFFLDIREAVDATTGLPSGLEYINYQRAIDDVPLYRFALLGKQQDQLLVSTAKHLRDQLSSHPDVSQVRLNAARDREIAIEIDENKLREYGLTLAEVSRQVSQFSTNVSAGRIKTVTGDVQLRVSKLSQSEEDLRGIVIRQLSSGSYITLGDIAEVKNGFVEDSDTARVNGKPTVIFEVIANFGQQDVVEISSAVADFFAIAEPTLPDGYRFVTLSDDSEAYQTRMQLLKESALLGLALVLVVLFFTLHPIVAFWVSAGIGVAFIGAFALLAVFGISLNIVSTFALLLVLGILVDDAIVVGESIHSETMQGESGDKAAADGVNRVSKPVIMAVVTTVIAFAPWALITTNDVQMTAQLSAVITFALLISLVESLLILPSHLTRLKSMSEWGRLGALQSKVSESLINFAHHKYRHVLELLLSLRYSVLALFLGGLCLTYALFNGGWVGFYFLPAVESDFVTATVQLPRGTPRDRALDIAEQLEGSAYRVIADLQGSINASEPVITSIEIQTHLEKVEARLQLVQPSDRIQSSQAISDQWRIESGNVFGAASVDFEWSLTQWLPQIDIRLGSDDTESLAAASLELQRHLASYDSTYFVRDSEGGALLELQFELRPGVERLGVTPQLIGRQIRSAFEGDEVQRLPTEQGDVRVVVRYSKTHRESLTALESFRLELPSGSFVPLTNVADIKLVQGSNRIDRRNGTRSITVSAYTDEASLYAIWDSVYTNFIPALEEKYPSVRVNQGGLFEAEDRFYGQIESLYIGVLFLMYALIAVSTRSYILPGLIMCSIPFGAMGAILGHWLFDIPLALFSFFGIGAVAGVAVNDNLVLVHAMQRYKDQGAPKKEAMVNALVSRFRPIFLTTLTTFVGLLPMMAEQSTSAEFLKPAVLSVAFGVLFALLATLVLVPCLYVIADDVRSLIVRTQQSFGSRLLAKGP